MDSVEPALDFIHSSKSSKSDLDRKWVDVIILSFYS